MSKTLALVGNPNCGKTTLFNELTGSSQYVGNWPGVTVEKKAGKLKGHSDIEVMDLPGVYSLSPYTLEEVITRDYLLEERPSVIVNIVDASNLERNLYLTTQILELGIPVVVALNMMDIIRKNGDEINIANLAGELGCPVYPIEAANGVGLAEMLKEAISLAEMKVKTYSLDRHSRWRADSSITTCAARVLAFLMFCASSSTTRCQSVVSQRSRSRCNSE